ncbi:MAG: hypothetical protein OQL19_09475 [Gammaproteobacteria bacterium]|nr:hypothetical protein [Gammaproteobacteria bacterium]
MPNVTFKTRQQGEFVDVTTIFIEGEYIGGSEELEAMLTENN